MSQESVDVSLRVAWGGGPAKSWTGKISISEGAITRVRSLGIEPDQPGSIWLADGVVLVSPRTPRSYDGVDITVTAPKTAKLRVDLRDNARTRAADAAHRQLEIPVSKVVGELQNAALDDQGNWLLARRAPGDQLRVALEPNHTLLRAGERFAMTVQPHLLPAKPGTSVRLTSTWVRGRHGEQVHSKTKDLMVAATGAVPPARFEFQLPRSEGVYTAKLVASYRPTLGWRQTLASRSVQFVVLDPNAGIVAPVPRKITTARDVIEIDRANPKWWERFVELSPVPSIAGIRPKRITKIPSPRIPGIAARPLGSGHVSKHAHASGTFSSLAPGGWEAYPVAGCEPGKSHELVVEYPSDLPQQLAISVVEPNAAGAIVPLGLDSGVYVEPGLRSGIAKVAKHRVVFWPRSEQPYVLLSARGAQRP
ncbi:MAG: hypothetical protein MI757_16410, partial [Pirellulales bacterium]|nr:hypothetical protein [Pirellulales bacterium]